MYLDCSLPIHALPVHYRVPPTRRRTLWTRAATWRCSPLQTWRRTCPSPPCFRLVRLVALAARARDRGCLEGVAVAGSYRQEVGMPGHTGRGQGGQSVPDCPARWPSPRGRRQPQRWRDYVFVNWVVAPVGERKHVVAAAYRRPFCSHAQHSASILKWTSYDIYMYGVAHPRCKPQPRPSRSALGAC